MDNFILACSSTVDQPEAFFEERGIPYICFRWISDDGEVHMDDLGRTVPFSEFYASMREGAMPKTSQPNFQDFTDFFEPYLREGRDILYLALSSAISGSFGGAVSAAEALSERYPERRIEIADSRNASLGYAMIVDAVWRKKRDGANFEECAAFALSCRERAVTLFYSTDLTWYVRGGRVKPAAGLIGRVLNICPVLHVNGEGALIPCAKIRGRTKAAQYLIGQMEERARDGREYGGPVFMVHSDCAEEAERLAETIRERFPSSSPRVSSIGCVIGSHTGPGTVGIAFWGEHKLE